MEFYVVAAAVRLAQHYKLKRTPVTRHCRSQPRAHGSGLLNLKNAWVEESI